MGLLKIPQFFASLLLNSLKAKPEEEAVQEPIPEPARGTAIPDEVINEAWERSRRLNHFIVELNKALSEDGAL